MNITLKDPWRTVLQIALSVLTALTTALGVHAAGF